MHELPITQSIVRLCVEEMEKHNVKKVNSIKIKVGELSGLVPECIQYYFDIISKDTKANGAKIVIEKLPIKIECLKCGYITESHKGEIKCLKCGSTDIKIIGGFEYILDSMEVDDDGN